MSKIDHVMKEMAMKNAEEAFLNERTRTKHFDVEANSSFVTNNEVPDGEHSQPQIFRGKLKGYQLKGMNWLANLYSQGISGILADEMGLGKTVQSIAFLCHIAEMYDVWGPFLIISPASTLHNWQQEIEKFVPSFKVVPYWGNPHERKILRQFWDQKDIYTKKASFHIVITSYQIVITDIKYFNRIKWQYMILDEAQAIKSTSSMRWKTLLGFSCRNRLLLSGTPIQNSMAELWALLHFIMPTLFDSHEEFNEWFSKDIESHAENKTGIDEKHLSRLHMILKPFMLRRIKKDVENELSDKIEIMVYCPLTTRQQLLYIALKQKIKIEDLIHYSVGGGDAHHVDKSFTSNLMNLVMQFRKVCNHPELFERRDAKSPITTTQIVYVIPSLIYHYNIRKQMLYLMQKYYLFNSKVIAENFKSFRDSIFNFCLLLNLSFEDLSEILQGNMFKRLEYFYNCEKSNRLAELQNIWPTCSKKFNLRIVSQNYLGNYLKNSEKYNFLLLNSCNRRKLITYGFSNNISFSLSRKKNAQEILDTVIDVVNETPEFLVSENPDRPLISVNFQDVPMSEVTHFVSYLPSFLFGTMPKIRSPLIQLYCPSRAAAWDQIEMTNTIRYNCLLDFWSRTTNNSFSEASQSFTLNFETTDSIQPVHGWSSIFIPDKETLVTDAGKLSVLDNLLKKLKKEGHRVLIYSQMTKMIDLLEEYMWHRHHKYMRLDGSSKISERRDMVADFQARSDIFVFLLSTRAGGLGINLTAADTVIFYDSDWNPTVDQQAMDRAHRLGQTKQVTVYRLICKGTIEERILQRAREKNEIQKLVISGGNFKPDSLKPKEVVSLLLDEEELIQRVHKPAIKTEAIEEVEKKKKSDTTFKTLPALTGKYRTLNPDTQFEDQFLNVDSTPTSPRSTTSNDILTDDLSESSYFDDTDSLSNKYTVYNVYGSTVKPKPPLRGQSKRGRPRGSRSRTSLSRINTINSTSSGSGIYSAGPEANIMENTNTVLSPNLTENQAALTGSRRGPGRPRLKPSGPANTSSRGTYKPRKPAKPLPVPIPSDPSSNFSSNLNQNIGSSNSNLYSSYVFDFPDQIPDT